ncbi:MAG: response regulator transcription factor [Bacteroides sp.]
MASLIYVVEDDQNIREIESFALKNSGYIVEAFDCGKAFFTRIKEKMPDLVLLDIMLPDIDGMEILKRLKNDLDMRRIPVIMVTAKSSEIDKVKGLDQGADDYMTKPFGVMELISRVKAILRRSSSISEDKIFKLGSITINDEKHAVFADDNPVDLTFKEYNLLKLLVANAGIVMSRDVIMDRIWGTSFEGESRTLDMHIKTLRKKLGDSGALIKTIRNVGYVISLD